MIELIIEDNEIKNQDIKNFIKNIPKEELKEMFLFFLENKLEKKQKNRWENFINDIEKIETKEVSKYIQQSSQDIRENLNFREVYE